MSNNSKKVEEFCVVTIHKIYNASENYWVLWCYGWTKLNNAATIVTNRDGSHLGFRLLIKATVRNHRGFIKTPFRSIEGKAKLLKINKKSYWYYLLERLRFLPGSTELKITDFLGNSGTLMLGLQAWDQPCLESARLLGVQVTKLFRHINEGVHFLIVAFLRAFFSSTSSTTDLHWELFTFGVPNKLTFMIWKMIYGIIL